MVAEVDKLLVHSPHLKWEISVLCLPFADLHVFFHLPCYVHFHSVFAVSGRKISMRMDALYSCIWSHIKKDGI